MNLYDVAIRRPVFTIMMTAALVIFGVLGYVALPINIMPSMDFPIVTVMTILPGASPEVVETDITDVIENEVNTIEGIELLASQSLSGLSMVTITFELERDIDIAAQDVRDKVAIAVGNLPVDAEQPIVMKLDSGSFPMLWFALKGLDRRQMSDYVDQVIKPKMQSLPGVGNIHVMGLPEPMMRIWIHRDRLSAHGLTVHDVIAAVQRENLELPGGLIEGPRYELTVRNTGLLETADEFNNLIVATVDGRPIRLSDVGIAQEGVGDQRASSRNNLEPSGAIGVALRSGANMVAVHKAARAKMDELARDFPRGMRSELAYDGAEYIEISIRNVQVDIVYGAVLAILVVFVFLRSWRSTFIVSLAIPTSLIATFGFMRLFGFSLNNLTTLALALSVGVVIDDAIVVLENIFRHQEEGERPFRAALNGTKEIALAATAATFSIAAVFIPVAYMRGMIGLFLFEFGISVAAAILISLFVALTLTPMASSRMLRITKKHGRFYEALENGFQALERGYRRGLDLALNHKVATLLIAVAAFAGSLALLPLIGAEFAPREDMSNVMISVEAPAGTSLEAMEDYMIRLQEIVMSQPEMVSMFGVINMESREGVNHGMMFCDLLKPHLREASQTEFAQRMRRLLAEVEGVQARPSEFSFYQFRGEEHIQADLMYSIRGPELDELDRIGRRVIDRLSEYPGFVDLDTTLDLEQPQVYVEMDRERAQDLGFTAATIYETVYTLIAGREIGSYTKGGKRYDVWIKVLPEQARSAEDIGALMVRTPSGRLVRLDSMVTIRHGVGPVSINRADRQRSMVLNANLEGMRFDRAKNIVEQVLAEELPTGYVARASGQAEEFEESMSSLIFAMGLAIVIVYMLLASQFNSFIHPFTIMFALPLALVGALLGLLITGHTLNIMSAIGIILLFGLVTKNSILLVDFTIQKQQEGKDRETALREACPIRLRPILMTAVSMIFGVLPVALAIGEGAEARAPMAVATAGGMLSSTALTLFVVPVVYSYMDRFSERLLGRSSVKRAAEAVAAA
jgi:HAE1 family hydrophobic/amphiphilic exporter-1